MGKSVLLDFEKLDNVRDIGGMKCSDGRKIRMKKLIRSAHLSSPSEKDKKTLISLVDTVIDLRTKSETLENPDVILTGVNNVHVSILDELTPGYSPGSFLLKAMTSDPELSKKYMCDLYASLALNDRSVSQYGKFIRLLAKRREKAVLFHCTAGKDRAGTAALIIETILGVPEEDILNDYLMTNEYTKENILSMTHEAKRREGISDKNADKALWYLFAAEADYLKAFYAAANTRFGSISAFISDGLGVSDDDIRLLKDIYLE
ncbi:MAG: tyrosine-protein phosphatase [Clostridia bacterium]|nr:tyrosine-protein phosphatase [Clostridia bacterium]